MPVHKKFVIARATWRDKSASEKGEIERVHKNCLISPLFLALLPSPTSRAVRNWDVITEGFIIA
jgi:hypothetical protein